MDCVACFSQNLEMDKIFQVALGTSFQVHSNISAWGIELVGMIFIGFAVKMWMAVI